MFFPASLYFRRLQLSLGALNVELLRAHEAEVTWATNDDATTKINEAIPFGIRNDVASTVEERYLVRTGKLQQNEARSIVIYTAKYDRTARKRFQCLQGSQVVRNSE